MGVEFLEFLNELDAELRLLEAMRLRAKPPRRLARSGKRGLTALLTEAR